MTSFQLYLFNEILTKCNKTDCKSRGEIDWIYQHPSVAMTSGDWHNGKQLPVGWIGNQFLTCFTQRFLTFEFYLTPFQPELWTCLLVWIVLIVSSLTIFTIYGGCATKSIVSAGTSGYKSFSPWFLVLSTIFEKSTPVPRKLQRKTFYRLVFGIWAVSAILFTNSYTGGMISTLNAPLPEVRMENWNHVIRDCDEAGMGVSAKTINILSWMNSTGISKYWEDVTSIEVGIDNRLENPYELENCLRLLSPAQQRHYDYLACCHPLIYPPTSSLTLSQTYIQSLKFNWIRDYSKEY